MAESDFEKAQQAAAMAATVLPAFLSVMDKIADLILKLHQRHDTPEAPKAG